MINLKCFFKGVSCAKKIDSPAIALGVSFIAIGALLRNLGFTIQESVFSTFLTYALPGSLVMKPKILLVDEPSIGLEPKYIDMVFEILHDLQHNEKKTIILVEQNAKKGLEFSNIGYVLSSGKVVLAGQGDDLLNDAAVGRLFLGG